MPRLRQAQPPGLARQKLPEQLEVLAALPHTDSGKLHRGALKDRFSAAQ